MIPGINVYKLATSVIAKQNLDYYQYTGRELNAAGQYVTVYAPPVPVAGSFQPIPQSLYQQLGLDMQKNYWNLYIDKTIADIRAGVSGDELAFFGKRYQCESVTPWEQVDGWMAVLCVEVGDA